MIAFALLLAPSGAGAALHLQKVGRAGGLGYLTSVVAAPGDPSALYVTQRTGLIKRLKGGNSRNFLDLRGRVLDSRDIEQGLFSIVFAPQSRPKRRFYVIYSNNQGDEQIDEFRTNRRGRALKGSRRTVLVIPHQTGNAHYAGDLQFGPDGFLYVSTGDAENPANSQDLTSLLGKILRIDPRPAGGRPYTIPKGNPFASSAGRDEIWSYGLRNPFRFSFDHANGALIVGDVGDAGAEEVDLERRADGAGRGVNFGWPCREGFRDGPIACTAKGAESPKFAYPHTSIDGSEPRCAILGGYLARGPGLGGVRGRYVYADFCAAQIRSVVLGRRGAHGDRLETRLVDRVQSFGEDGRGRVYVVAYSGLVYRLVARAGGRESGHRAVARRGSSEKLNGALASLLPF